MLAAIFHYLSLFEIVFVHLYIMIFGFIIFRKKMCPYADVSLAKRKAWKKKRMKTVLKEITRWTDDQGMYERRRFRNYWEKKKEVHEKLPCKLQCPFLFILTSINSELTHTSYLWEVVQIKGPERNNHLVSANCDHVVAGSQCTTWSVHALKVAQNSFIHHTLKITDHKYGESWRIYSHFS